MSDYYQRPPRMVFSDYIAEMRRVMDDTPAHVSTGAQQESRCYLCRKTAEETGSLKRPEKFWVCDECHELGGPATRQHPTD